MTEQFGLLARDQLTCGMHVHVAVDDPDQATAALTGIAPWLPVLLALSANSPFYGGSDSGYASYRTVLWGRWPTAGPTGSFGDRAEYDALRRDLIATGAARDDGMIYFDARLSVDYPTVEIRVCDVCVEVGDAVLIAALARGLVTAALQAEPAPPVRPELLRAATWRAARWGMAGELVAFGTGRPRLLPAWDLIGELRDLVGPALEEAGDADRVDAALRAVQDRGTGADRQRQAYAGDGGFEAVVQAVTVAPG
jgi:carboxylate-amine ligase